MAVASVAAPAYATSSTSAGCTTGTHYTYDIPRDSQPVTEMSLTPGVGPDVVASFTFATSRGETNTPGLTGIRSDFVHEPASYVLVGIPAGAGEDDWTRTEIRFSEPVVNPTITIGDIDWAERVVADPPTFVVSNRGTYVKGVGLPLPEDADPLDFSVGPFRNRYEEVVLATDWLVWEWEVCLTWPGPWPAGRPITVTYSGGTDRQCIGIGNIGFDLCG